MKTVATVLAVACAATCLSADFNIVEKKSEIERLSKEVDKTKLYVQQASDNFLLQFAQIEGRLNEIGTSDEEVNALIQSVAYSLTSRIEAINAKYDSIFNTVEQFALDAKNMYAYAEKLANGPGLRPTGDYPPLLFVDGYWDGLEDRISKFPNPVIWKSAGFWSSPISDYFYYEKYSSPCDFSKCQCGDYHGRSNMPEFSEVLARLQKLYIRVERSKSHPPSF